jgi:transcriptional regulator with XRE-family HTH domain
VIGVWRRYIGDVEDAFDSGAFGRFVRQRREALGITKFAAASVAGVSDTYWRTLELGKFGRIGVGTLQRVASALDVSVLDLLEAAGVDAGSGVVAELGEAWAELGSVDREALVKIARVLADARPSMAPASGVRLVAAYDREIPRSDDSDEPA